MILGTTDSGVMLRFYNCSAAVQDTVRGRSEYLPLAHFGNVVADQLTLTSRSLSGLVMAFIFALSGFDITEACKRTSIKYCEDLGVPVFSYRRREVAHVLAHRLV